MKMSRGYGQRPTSGLSQMDLLFKKCLSSYLHRLKSQLLEEVKAQCRKRETGIVRTDLEVNEQEKSMNFEGDIFQGTYALFMKVNFDRFSNSASDASLRSREGLAGSSPELAILISGVGRKLMLE